MKTIALGKTHNSVILKHVSYLFFAKYHNAFLLALKLSRPTNYSLSVYTSTV